MPYVIFDTNNNILEYLTDENAPVTGFDTKNEPVFDTRYIKVEDSDPRLVRIKNSKPFKDVATELRTVLNKAIIEAFSTNAKPSSEVRTAIYNAESLIEKALIRSDYEVALGIVSAFEAPPGFESAKAKMIEILSEAIAG